MIQRSSNIAVLYFTRTPEEEIKRKHFWNSTGKKGNTRISVALIEGTSLTLRKTGLPVFKITTHEQIGNSFGERFANAFRQVFEKGFGKVIAVGNDCPELTEQDIKNAELALIANEFVIGPTSKGGAYLIGISKNSFVEEQFKILRWNSSLVLNDLLCYAKKYGTNAFQLTKKNDINNENDLNDFLRFSPINSFLIKIRSIISSFAKNIFNRIYQFTIFLLRSSMGLRAPPFLPYSFN